MVKIIKILAQLFILLLFIQLPQIGEMNWGNIDKTTLGFLVHLVYWGVANSFAIYVLSKLRKNYLDTNSIKYKYSYIKTILLVVVGIVTQLLILNIMPEKSYSNSSETIMELFHSDFGFLALISINFIIPILEEYLFRGIFQERIKKYGNPFLAIIISAILFAFVHTFEINTQFIMISCQGLIFSWLYHKTNDLKYPSIAHILTNIIVTILHYI